MDYDLASNLKGLPCLEYATYSTDQTSAALDTSLYNYKGLTLALEIGVGGITFITSNKVEYVITVSDDDSTYVAVTDDDVILLYPGLVATGGIVKSLIAAHAAADVTYVGIRSKKRYVKVKFDFSGTHSSGTPMGAHWCLNHPMSAPNVVSAIPDMV
jgi:hypothetical protein